MRRAFLLIIWIPKRIERFEVTVTELINFLQKQPQDLQVAFAKYSEQRLLVAEDIEIFVGCEPRPDGWIQDKRPDKSTQTYLLFPGN